ncbi:MAG TPA: UDP-N-acetylmuramoyl-tripeptide--D-alanyl-D-alanine ligase [Casimicrobiaceae bacterium]
MDTATAAGAVGGSVIGASVPFLRVTTDTRGLVPGDLFVALRGERFDGHDFVGDALGAGAAAALVERGRAAALSGNLIAVDDPLHSLGRLAAYWRTRFDIPVAVVTGSNGKTTTKEMIASIFRAAVGDDAVAATPGNFNNAIGLPLAVLALRAPHRLAVFEIGMNHRGETRALAAIALPTIAVVTNAQREHQEFMRSVDEVAAEHADVIRGLRGRGAAILNADDARVATWRAVAADGGHAVVTFGLDHAADFSARHAVHRLGGALELASPAGNAHVLLHAPGRHMASNALAAAAAAHAAGMPLTAIVAGLEAFRPVRGRLAASTTAAGVVVIDDSYNANPDSVRAAIDVLAACSGARWLVLGDMGEVGADGPAFHREIGTYARAAGIDRLFAAGALAREAADAFGAGAEAFASVGALAPRVAAVVRGGVTVLVKGSRFMRMERVVATLGAANGGGH